MRKQDCIPVGCVPPLGDCIPACTAQEGFFPGCVPRGCVCPGGCCAQVGCLPGVGVSAQV